MPPHRSSAPRFQLRPAQPTDCDFLGQLKHRVFKEYAEATWRTWDEEQQWERFCAGFRPEEFEVIVIDGVDAGFLEISETPDQIRIKNIVVAPEWQRQGVGTAIVRDIQGRADRTIWLRVLKVNPARRFYERLHFAVVGTTETHWWAMKWEPRAAKPDR